MNQLPALLRIDSYKLGHMAQYPEGTEFIYSNFTPRSLYHFDYPDGWKNDNIVAFGMRSAITELHNVFQDTFFNVPKQHVLEQFEYHIRPFIGEFKFRFENIEELWELGYLPLKFKTLPEGSIVTPQIPVLTVVNTDSRFYWLTNFIETWLSAALWKPMVSATIAYNYRRVMDHYAKHTGSPEWFTDFQGHDFSVRGMSGIEDAARSGMGHLLFFKGSDNIPSAWKVRNEYDVKDEELIATSVPATEHSVMCAGGEVSEIDTFRRLINETYPSGIVSIVSDTWDFWKVVRDYAKELKEDILKREGKTVFRPDSGNPVDVICGSNGQKGAIDFLWDTFGGTYTDKGYKVLDEHVGLIYGDSITLQRCVDILDGLEKKGFASCNIVLGIGSFTYQHVTRDTIGAAMKATHAVVNGESRNLFKDPVTDRDKKSATGLLQVVCENGQFILNDKVSEEVEKTGELKPLCCNGTFFDDYSSFEEIRVRVKQ